MNQYFINIPVLLLEIDYIGITKELQLDFLTGKEIDRYSQYNYKLPTLFLEGTSKL